MELFLVLLLILYVSEIVALNHISPCGKTNLTDLTGSIESPNYPNPYLSQVKCLWTIYSPSQSVLKLTILDLDLDQDCEQHWLSVPFEGGRGSNRLCGRKAPALPITVAKTSISVEYYSSELRKESRGFSLLYNVELSSCGAQEIHCRNGGCVSKSSHCNGVRDCLDGSDEVGCPVVTTWCADGTVSCLSSPKHCFSPEQTCDGEFFCPNGEDELSCAPGCPNQIACGSGDGCYDPSQRCNGVRNCRDNSDETDCTEAGCGSLEFICSNRQCIAAASLCDGIDDCGDLSDEQHCAKPSLLAVATLGLLACVFLSCIGLSCLYRFYTARLRASTAFLQHLDPEGLETADDGFVYREPPPSYSMAIAETHQMALTQELEPPPRRHRRRQRRRRMSGSARPALLPVAKHRGLPQIELAGHVLEPHWRTPASSPSLSPSRESVTSSTSVEDFLN